MLDPPLGLRTPDIRVAEVGVSTHAALEQPAEQVRPLALEAAFGEAPAFLDPFLHAGE